MAILSRGYKPRKSQLHDVTIVLDSKWAVLVFLKALVFWLDMGKSYTNSYLEDWFVYIWYNLL